MIGSGTGLSVWPVGRSRTGNRYSAGLDGAPGTRASEAKALAVNVASALRGRTCCQPTECRLRRDCRATGRTKEKARAVRLGPETTIEEVEETVQSLLISLVRCNKKQAV